MIYGKLTTLVCVYALLSVLMLGAAFAMPGEEAVSSGRCRERTLISGRVRAYIAPLDDTECMITIGPSLSSSVESLTFRQYFFRTDGLMSVHVSTEGPDPSSTGTRGFFMFPRTKPLSVEMQSNGDVEVRMTTGASMVFSAESARVKSFSGGRFIEDPAISMRNYGGFEFISFSGILLDTGWQVRGSAYGNRARKSLFRDRFDNYCVVENPEVFDYSDRARFKFRTDHELAEFLEQRCPTLKFFFR